MNRLPTVWGPLLEDALRGCFALLNMAPERTILPYGWDTEPPVTVYVDSAGAAMKISGVMIEQGRHMYYACDLDPRVVALLDSDDIGKIGQLEGIANMPE